MKTPNAPRLFAVAILACTALFLAACGQATEEKDTGPNANLSNDQLLKKAVDNMKVLKSYHFDVKGQLPNMAVEMMLDMHMDGDMQTEDKGSRIKMVGELNSNYSGPTPESAIPTPGPGVDIILAKGVWYESYDGDKTWDKPHIDTPAYLTIATVGLVWDPRFSFGYPTPGERMIQGLTYKDGSPRVERIEGSLTRHIVTALAERNNTNGIGEPLMALEGTKSLSIWVSTDITPTIRQMKVEGMNAIRKSENEQPTDTPFTLTWKWSHFNEDFGEIKAPPTETVKTP